MANLDVIRTLTLRAKAEGFAQAEGAVKNLGESVETSARRQLSAEKTLASYERRLITGAKETQEYAKIQRQMGMVLAQFPQAQERVNAVLASAADRLKNSGGHVEQLGNKTKAARYEMLNFSRQVQDVGVGLASGQSAMTVMIQQGTQIADIFASASLAGRNFGKELLGLITPMRLLAFGTVAAAAAGVLLFNSWKNVELQFLNTSERINVTTKSLHALDEAAAPKGISTEELLQNIEQFGDQVNLAKRGLGDLGELFRLNSVRSKGLIEDFARVADLVKNARIEERVNVLRSAGLPVTPAWVQFMRQGGDAIREAVTQAEQFGTQTDDSMIKKAREFDEAWNKAWKNFSVGWRAMFQEVIEGLDEWINKSSSLGNLFKEGMRRFGLSAEPGKGFTAGTEEQIRELGRRRLMQMPSEGGPPPGFGGLPPPPVPKLKITVRPGPTITQEDLKAQERIVSLERQRVQALGELATETEKAKLKRDELNLATMQGVNLSEQEINKLVKIAELEEKARKSSMRVSALGEAATAAEKYASQIDALNVKLAEGVINQEDFNRAALQLNPIFQQITKAVQQIGDDLAAAFIDGKDAAEALNTSLKSVAKTAASDTIRNLMKGDLGAAAVSAAVGITAFIGSKLFGGATAAEKQAAQQAAEARQQAAEQQAARRDQFRLQADLASIDTSTQVGALAAFERRAQAAREEESKAGGQAMEDLERSLAAERLNIEKDFAERLTARIRSYEDRLFAATTDVSTLAGQLAAFDRTAQQQREDEAKAGGQAMGQLEEALWAERLNIIKDYNDKILEEQKQAGQEIVAYLQSLLTGSLSPLSAKAQLEAARSAYEAQLMLAQGGDIVALQNITKVADTLLKASQAFFGSSAGYSREFQTITGQLSALANVSGFAGGGWVTGGTAGRDSVALGMPGEFVVQQSVAQANSSWLPQFNATGSMPANDNVVSALDRMGSMLSSLLQQIANLEEQGNAKLDVNTAVIAGQTQALTREQRFAARKKSA